MCAPRKTADGSIRTSVSKCCVGWHWFKYMDNDPEDLKTDPSNRDSNKGMVKWNFEPYPELLERMQQFNDRTYRLIKYIDEH